MIEDCPHCSEALSMDRVHVCKDTRRWTESERAEMARWLELKHPSYRNGRVLSNAFDWIPQELREAA